MAFVKRSDVATGGNFNYSIELLPGGTVLALGLYVGIKQIDWANTANQIVFMGRLPNGKTNNVYVLNLLSGTVSQLASRSGFPSISSDELRVSYTKRGDIKVLTLATGITETVSRLGEWPDWKN
ncbi:MAG: hypothetical protein IH951_08685 [Bacteroidetes bacterium]|nr:hypothetical protein [Bacteroidota bacterium]